MFPIPFNFPFRKKDGSMTTIGDEISSGGGGGGYTLPTASASTKGGIKIGAGLSMDGEVLNNTNPTPPSPYNLPTASAETLGGIKVGTNLSIDENGVLSASGGGGGGTKYKHYITLADGSLDSGNHVMFIEVETSSNTKIFSSSDFANSYFGGALTKIATALNFTLEVGESLDYPVTGWFYSDSVKKPLCAVRFDYSSEKVDRVIFVGDYENYNALSVYSLSASYCNEIVV